MALLGQVRERADCLWHLQATWGYHEHYGTSRPIKRQLTAYATSRPRGVNKMQKLLERKNKNGNKNGNQTENKNENSFLFSFLFLFSFCFSFSFLF